MNKDKQELEILQEKLYGKTTTYPDNVKKLLSEKVVSKQQESIIGNAKVICAFISMANEEPTIEILKNDFKSEVEPKVFVDELISVAREDKGRVRVVSEVGVFIENRTTAIAEITNGYKETTKVSWQERRILVVHCKNEENNYIDSQKTIYVEIKVFPAP